eukprot:scaffold304_cov80-Skeletonema_menzelii.AAC.24
MKYQAFCLATLWSGAYATPQPSDSPSISLEPSSQPSAFPSNTPSSDPTVSLEPSDVPSIISSISSEPSFQPSQGPSVSLAPSISLAPSVSLAPSSQPSTATPTARPSVDCVYMDPNPFTFGPPVPSKENNNLWPEDYSFWTSQVIDTKPWTVQRSSTELYYLQSPNANGAPEFRQANATLHICGGETTDRALSKSKDRKFKSLTYGEFAGGDMEVSFDADVRETNGQLFQVVVDGVIARGGDVTTPQRNTKLVVALSPGNHWVEFVYTWTPQANLPTTSTGVVKIFSVTLPPLNPGFPTFTPTDTPSTSPTTLPPTTKPTPSPTLMNLLCPFILLQRSPTVSPTLSPT